MSKLIKINDVNLAPIEYRGARVMTLTMMDEVHGRPDGTARRNYTENKKHLIEGEDFHEVTADEIRTQSLGDAFAPCTSKGILLTETGYSMLVKSFTDDLAWDVQRQLVKSYFAKPSTNAGRGGSDPALSNFRQSRAIATSAKTAESICALFPDLGQAAKQTIFAKLVNAAAGQDVVPLPMIEQLWSATDVAKQYQVTPNAIGRLATAHGLKVDKYGQYAMDKSQHSDKQMATFRYNAAGVARIGELLSAGQVQPDAQPALELVGGVR